MFLTYGFLWGILHEWTKTKYAITLEQKTESLERDLANAKQWL